MKTYDITPKPAMLRAIQNQRWTVAGALAELVDNSYGQGRGNARRVEISYHHRHHLLSVLDDGRGMGAVGDLFKLGEGAGRTINDIGEYGSGGTMALLWLYSDVTVWTLRDGMVSHVNMHWPSIFKADDFPRVADEWRKATPSNTPEELFNVGAGTLIKGQLLRTRKIQLSNTRRDLAATFAPATRYGKELLWQGEYLADPLPSFAAGKSVAIDLVLRTPDGHDLGVRGEIGEIADLPLSRSYVHIGFGPRVVKRTRDFFESPDGTDRFRVAGIAGWLDLLDGWQPYLATTKDEIGDTPVYEALRASVFEKIRPLLQDLRRRKEHLLLEGLALELNQAFDIGAESEVPVEEPPPVEINGYEKTGKRSFEKHEREREADSNSAETERKPVLAKLELSPLSDLEMQNRLCHAEPMGDGIAVYINEEHGSVRIALEREPVNRLALSFLVLGEVASVVDHNEHLLRRIFRPGDARNLLAKDAAIREGVIHRVLIDRVHALATQAVEAVA